MKTCPVCGESFGDDLNFCDVDGTALARDPLAAAQAKNKLWSILGVALLLGALAISALSVIFLPKARVSSPAVVSSVPPLPETPPATKPTSTDTAGNSQTPLTSSEPEALLPPDTVAPELKKRETAPGRENGNLSKSAKAAALAAEESEKPNLELQPATAPAKKSEAPPAKTVSDKHDTEPPRATAPIPTDPKAAGTKTADNSNSKKKGDDKDKKKGGFFKVFKKIFGKD
jgi:hypothetical protein